MLLHNSPYKLFEDLLFADQTTTLYPFSQKDESFEALDLDTTIDLEVEHEGKVYLVPAKIKTSKEYVKGRPIRYGIVFDLSEEDSKKEFNELKKIWNQNKKVKIRKKFDQLKENGSR